MGPEDVGLKADPQNIARGCGSAFRPTIDRPAYNRNCRRSVGAGSGVMKLYDYFRSSAAYRVRIALNLKGLSPQREFVHLRNGAQRSDDYRRLNPQGLVPALALEGGQVLTQSLAILEYLEETHPSPPLLPKDASARARVRAIAMSIACDIHPLDNLRVLDYLTGTLGVSREAKDGWYRYWIDVGFEALERQLAQGGQVLVAVDDVPGHPHDVLRPPARLGEHRDDVRESLPRLRGEVVGLERLRGVPADLAADRDERAARGDAVRVAFRLRPAGRLQDLQHGLLLCRVRQADAIWRSLKRCSLPVSVRGSDSTNSIARGYL